MIALRAKPPRKYHDAMVVFSGNPFSLKEDSRLAG